MKNSLSFGIMCILTILFVSAFSIETKAHMDTVGIIPQHPSSTDEVTVFAKGWFPDLCWNFDSCTIKKFDANTFNFNIFGNDIWQTGMACALAIVPYQCNRNIGFLSPGTYTVDFTEYHNSVRDPWPDQKQMHFYVRHSGTHSTIHVEVPDTFALQGDTTAIPINVEDVTGMGIYSAEVILTFAESVLTAISATAEGAISQAWGLPTYSITPGEISIAMAGVTPLNGSGALAYVSFAVSGSEGDTTTIHFDKMQFNEGDPASSTTDGLFTVGVAQPIPVWIPDTSAQKGESICIPIKVDDVTDRDIFSVQLKLVWDDSILSCDSATTIGTIAENWGSPTYNCSDDTAITIAMAGISPLTGSGVLTYVCFSVIGCPSDTACFHLDVTLNEGDPPDSTEEGCFSVDPIISPTNCLATPFCDSIMVTWSDNSENEDGFVIYRDGDSLASVRPNTTSYHDTQLQANEHCYFVTAFLEDCGESEPSDTTCSSVYRKPGKPGSVDAGASARKITVSWLNVDNETWYKVFRNDVEKDSLPQDSCAWVDSMPLSDLQTHVFCYKIRAGNLLCESEYSDSACDSLYCIDGYVIDTVRPEPNPVADWPVEVHSPSPLGSSISLIDTIDTTVSDDTGYYRFELPVGTYSVSSCGTFYLPITLPGPPGSLDVHGQNFVVLNDTTVTDIEELEERNISNRFTLFQNYPNPFNPHTVIEYTLPQNSHVKIMICNLIGQKIRTLVNENQISGHKRIVWDGKNDQGQQVSSGVYLYQLKAGETVLAKKMVLLR